MTAPGKAKPKRFDPLQLTGAWQYYLSLRPLLNPAMDINDQFPETIWNDRDTQTLAVEAGVLNLQAVFLELVAFRAVEDTATQRSMRAALVVNNLSSAAMAMYNANCHGASKEQATVHVGVYFILATLAAAHCVVGLFR